MFNIAVFPIAVKNGAIRAVRPRLRLSGCQSCVSAAAQRAGHPRGSSQTGGVLVSKFRLHLYQHPLIIMNGNVILAQWGGGGA